MSSSILETEEDRKELPTHGRGAFRKLLLEMMVGSPSGKWSRSWGSMTRMGGNKRAWISELGGIWQNQGRPSHHQCGDPALTASLELSFSNRDIRFGLRHLTEPVSQNLGARRSAHLYFERLISEPR